jgi:hypothetical protein
MGLVLQKYYDGMIGHVLFSHEGVYFLKLTLPMMLLIRVSTKDCIDVMSKLVTYFYEDLERYRNIDQDPTRIKCLQQVNDVRCFTYDNREKYLSIQKIGELINGITLREILSISSPVSDLQNIVDQSRKCMTLAAERINGTLDIPIFEAQFVPMEEAVQNGVTSQLRYFVSPTNSLCPIPSVE